MIYEVRTSRTSVIEEVAHVEVVADSEEEALLKFNKLNSRLFDWRTHGCETLAGPDIDSLRIAGQRVR
jgi:hypothetical protein